MTALRAWVLLVIAWVSFARAPFATAAEPERWCDILPRPAYRDLERVKAPGDWFQVYRVEEGVFERSVDQLAALAPILRKLLPAHNVPVSDPKRLAELREAVRRVRSGKASRVDAGNGQIEFPFEGFSILTSKRALEGRPRDPKRGGSGLEAPADPAS